MASTLELNKIAAAVLTAGVVAMGTGFVAEVLVHPEEPEEPAYTVATAEPEAGEAPAEPAGPEPVLPRLAEASAAEGEKAVRACQACHSFDKGGPHKVGPNLYGVVGSDIAAAEGFSFSDALAGKEGAWTYERLNAFLADPQGWAKGTKMTFAGVSKVGKRADIIAYLRRQHDDPPPLPSEEEIAAVEQAREAEAAAAEPEAKAEGPDLAALLAEASAEDGQRVARACQACHSFEKGGPHKVGPNLYGVVGSDIAAAEGFSFSDALAGKSGAWTYDKLDAFLADPQGWAEGTKMTFAGVKKADKRADLIAFLRRHHDDPPPLPEAKAEAAPAEAAETAGAGQAEPSEGEQRAAAGDLATRLAAGSAEAGKKAIAACKACHTFDKGGMARVGPNLYGVAGKDIAGREDFDYSPALAGKDGRWTYAKLDAWIADPQGFAEGTKMTFRGVEDPGKRADIIAYLRRQHDDPPPLPGE